MHILPADSPRAPREDGPPLGRWINITDNTSQLHLKIPARWGNIWRNGWHVTGFPPFDGRVGPGLIAAPNVDSWMAEQAVPGVFIGVSSQIARSYNSESAARQITFNECLTIDQGPLSWGQYSGWYVEWECRRPLYNWLCIAATSAAPYLLYAQFKIVDGADVEIAEEILNSLNVSGWD